MAIIYSFNISIFCLQNVLVLKPEINLSFLNVLVKCIWIIFVMAINKIMINNLQCLNYKLINNLIDVAIKAYLNLHPWISRRMHPSTLLFFYHICIHLYLYCHAYQGKWQAIEIVMVVLSAYKIRQLNVVMNFNHNKTICIYMQI